MPRRLPPFPALFAFGSAARQLSLRPAAEAARDKRAEGLLATAGRRFAAAGE